MIHLVYAPLVAIVLSVGLYLAEKKTRFGRLSRKWRQLIIGLLFGLSACFATETGYDTGSLVINVRDASPLCAGLIFGWPAGALAGLIGGVERWFAVYWGAGETTRLACSLATLIAGVFGASLRKFLFDDKRPSWIFGLAVGMTTEVMHMLMIFLTMVADVQQAFLFIRSCAAPMISANALTVAIAMLAVSLIAGEHPFARRREKTLAPAFQSWLLLCVGIAFVATNFFTGLLQTNLSENDAESLLRLNIEDVQADIRNASDENLLALTLRVRGRIEAQKDIDAAFLQSLAKEYDVSYVHIINKYGVIEQSSGSEYVGYDMASSAQSAEFLVLLDRQATLVQKYQPTGMDASVSAKYAGAALSRGGFVQVGYDATRFQRDLAVQLDGITQNRRIGEGGGILIVDTAGVIVSGQNRFDGQKLDSVLDWPEEGEVLPDACLTVDVDGEAHYCMVRREEGYLIVALMPMEEVMFTRDLSVYVSMFMEVLVFAALFIHVYVLIKRLVVDNLRKVNASLEQITGGNLNAKVDVRSHREFASLSDDINQTVSTLRHYIAEAAARIDKELEFARSIQHAALPSVFPPYPGRRDFEIYARMDTAKEVGGDFYDFYFVSENRLAFMIADVSGKGIPAAMFMMTAKTTVKDLAESGMPVEEVLTHTNQRLCENNEAGMFVTAWMGILDLETGLVRFANAGHNPPLVRRQGGEFEYFKTRAGLVLAGMEGVRYRAGELQLQPGDSLFLYTDGVTEATDSHECLYGEERLRRILNLHRTAGMAELCDQVKADVDQFVGDAPQFDDITMLALKYLGGDPR